MVGQDVDSELQEPLVDVVDLQGLLGPIGGSERRGHQRHFGTVAAQLLGQHAAQVEVVVDEDRSLEHSAGHDVVGAVDALAVEARHPCLERQPDAVAAPVTAGREDHPRGAELAHVLRLQAACAIDLDVGHLAELPDAVVAHPDPFRETRQARLAHDPTAQLRVGLGEMHRVAALAQRARRLEPGRSGADDQHRVVRALGRKDLRVPALAPFLAHGRVLGAANR